LTNPPGSVIYNSFITQPKIFDPPLGSLSKIDFQVKIHDNIFYDFLGLDYSFTLLITEAVDIMASSSFSSRRGNNPVSTIHGLRLPTNNNMSMNNTSNMNNMSMMK